MKFAKKVMVRSRTFDRNTASLALPRRLSRWRNEGTPFDEIRKLRSPIATMIDEDASIDVAVIQLRRV